MMNNNNNPEAGQGMGQSSIKYKGVRLRKWGKWVAEIRLPNSRDRIWLGSYDSQEKAARAFDAALFCLRGRHAKFNFPDQLPPADILHDPHSLTAHQIQQIAAKFAHHHHSSSDHQNDAVPLSVDHILPPPPLPPPPPPTLDQYGYNDAINCTSSSASASEQQHNDNIMDWSFLDALDDSSSNFFPLYTHHSIDNISTNDFYQSTTVDDRHHYDAVSPDHDPHHSFFSNHSFLWNF